MSKRKLQAMETKKKIFETAQHLILEHGFENVSVDSIVKAADVSKGTFYVHIKSSFRYICSFYNGIYTYIFKAVL